MSGLIDPEDPVTERLALAALLLGVLACVLLLLPTIIQLVDEAPAPCPETTDGH